MKKVVITIFKYFGYTISKKIYSRPIDLSDLSNNPKALPYYTSVNRQILINTTLDKGRGLEIFSLSL